MTLELAKHLVEHGLVSAPEMDDVLQRQVLFGGSLGTNLLELDLIDETTLTRALTHVHRLPAATARLLEQHDKRIANLFPPRLSEKYQVIPVFVAGRTVHALAASRIDPLVEEEIGFMLSLGLKISLVCEARLQGLLRDWLGVSVDGRYAALLDRLGPFAAEPSPAPPTAAPEQLAAREALGKPPPVDAHKVEQVLQGIDKSEQAEKERRQRARSGRISLQEATSACQLASHRDEIIDVTLRFARQFMPFVGLFVTANDVILGWDAVGTEDARERIRTIRLPTSIATVLSMVTRTNAYYLGPIPETVGNNELLRDLGRSKPRNVLVVPITLRKRLIGMLYGDAGIRAIRGGAIGDLLVFASRLSGAFEQLIRKTKRQAAGQEPPAPLPEPEPPAPAPPPGPEPTGSVFDRELPPQIRAAAHEQATPPEEISATPPPMEAVAPEPAPPAPADQDEPVVVDDSFLDTSSLPPAVDAADLGIPPAPGPGEDELHPDEERVKIERIEDEEPAAISVVEYDDGQVVVVDTASDFAPATEPAHRPAPVPLGAPPPAAAVPEAQPAPPPHVPEPVTGGTDRIEEHVRDLVSGEPEAMARACDVLASIHPPPVDAVMAHFPGYLVFDIRGAHDSIPPLSEHSELLRCLIEMGADACPRVAQALDDSDSRVRYYAVKIFGETYCPRFVPNLAKRLYDRDALIRLTTIDVLQTYRKTPAFAKMLRELRERLKSSEPNQQAVSAALLGNFKDRDALPLLAGLVKSSRKMVARAAVESLSYITKQDFGTSERKWIKWWKGHKGQSRVEWLITGLRSKNRDIRFSSAQELNQLTQEYFGYYFDSSKEDREQAVRRWESWWQEKGRSLYVDL